MRSGAAAIAADVIDFPLATASAAVSLGRCCFAVLPNVEVPDNPSSGPVVFLLLGALCSGPEALSKSHAALIVLSLL